MRARGRARPRARAGCCCSCPFVLLQVMWPHVVFHARSCAHAHANILIYIMVVKRVGLGEGEMVRGGRAYLGRNKVDWGARQCCVVM